MTVVATPTRSPVLAPADQPEQTFAPETFTAPVVAAVDGSAASTAALDTAVRLAAEINTPLVFVYVRRGPAGIFGTPVYQRRLTAAMAKALDDLAARGATAQRCLWASTSVKDPSLRDTLYVEELIGPETISTMPEETIRAFQDHGRVELRLESDLDEAQCLFNKLYAVGVDYDDVVATLEREGIEKFVASVNEILDGIATKRRSLRAVAYAPRPASEDSPPPPAYAVKEVEDGGRDQHVRRRRRRVGERRRPSACSVPDRPLRPWTWPGGEVREMEVRGA